MFRITPVQEFISRNKATTFIKVVLINVINYTSFVKLPSVPTCTMYNISELNN